MPARHLDTCPPYVYMCANCKCGCVRDAGCTTPKTGHAILLYVFSCWRLLIPGQRYLPECMAICREAWPEVSASMARSRSSRKARSAGQPIHAGTAHCERTWHAGCRPAQGLGWRVVLWLQIELDRAAAVCNVSTKVEPAPSNVHLGGTRSIHSTHATGMARVQVIPVFLNGGIALATSSQDKCVKFLDSNVVARVSTWFTSAITYGATRPTCHRRASSTTLPLRCTAAHPHPHNLATQPRHTTSLHNLATLPHSTSRQHNTVVHPSLAWAGMHSSPKQACT